jgi:transposase
VDRSAGSGVRSARRSKRNSFLGPVTEAASHGLSRTPSASSRRSSITPRFRTCSGSPGQPSVIARRLVGEHLHEDRFDNLRAIGVDEFGFAAHHRYLTLVIDHDRQRVIWAAEGKSSETLAAFFDELGPERCASIEFVSIDMAAGYIKAVQDSRLTNARLEGINNKARLISHGAFGFHSAQPLIAMIYLCCSSITLPQLQLS